MTRIRAATSPSCGCWTSTRGPTSWPPPWASPWPTTTTRPSSETGKNKFHLVFLDFWNSSKEKIRAKWIKMKYNSFFLFSRLTTSLKMHQKGSWLKINFDFFSRGTFFFRHLWIKKWKKSFFEAKDVEELIRKVLLWKPHNSSFSWVHGQLRTFYDDLIFKLAPDFKRIDSKSSDFVFIMWLLL